MSAPDVAVVGGGIVGCSLAALLAEGGASVRLYEREAIAAAASGRNSGVLQHPMDEALVALHEDSLALYAGLGHGFELPAEAAGLIVVSADAEGLEAARAELAARFPELAPEFLDEAALAEAEPSAGPGLSGVRLATGRPVPPGAAARAWAERAREAGAELRIGSAVEGVQGGAGVVVDGAAERAGAVVVAAGPWTPAVVDPTGAWVPIVPVWGVNVEVRMPEPPRHVLEEAGVEVLTSPDAASGPLFSIVTAGGASAVGSTFLAEEPDAGAGAPAVLAHAARFLPALADPGAVTARACPRPQSLDGRPLLGPVAGGLHVASGHGPWGISLGPGSAHLVADGLLGRAGGIPDELAAGRFGAAVRDDPSRLPWPRCDGSSTP